MSKSQFELAVRSAPVNSVAKTWFPRWIGRFASFLHVPDNAELPVGRETVIGFLRMLRDRSVPAWQRLQAVDAILSYKTLVRRESDSILTDIRLKLTELAELERKSGQPNTQPGEIGIVDSQEPEATRAQRALDGAGLGDPRTARMGTRL